MAKEIASFATSNDGMILIGVDDNGQVSGIDGGLKSSVRKDMVEKVEKICSGCIKPSVTPTITFAIVNNQVVLVIRIKQGPEPLYYSTRNVPYKRNHSQARPAEPSDVVRIFSEYFGVTDKVNENDPDMLLATNLVNVVNEIKKIIDQSEQRCVNPWLEDWKYDLGECAAELRDIASSNAAINNQLADDALELADQVALVSSLREHLGSGPSRKEAIKDLSEHLNNFDSNHLSGISLSQENYKVIKEAIIVAHNKLNILVKRSNQLIEKFDYEELMKEASSIGKKILAVCYYDIDEFLNGNLAELKQISIDLDLIETSRIYSDVRPLMNQIQTKTANYSNRLSEIIAETNSIE